MIYRKTAIMDRLLIQGFIGYTGPRSDFFFFFFIITRSDYAVEQKVTYGIGGLKKV